jgi:hypothetical protein
LAPIEGVHLRCISPLLVFIIERGANAIADQTSQHAADSSARETIARAAASDRSTDHGTGARPDYGPGTFPWSGSGCRHRSRACTPRAWAHPIRASGAGGERKADDHNSS